MEVTSFIDMLKCREYGNHPIIYTSTQANETNIFYSIKSSRIHNHISKSTERKIDAECRGIIGFTNSLRNAIKSNKWKDISTNVGDIILNLLDNSNINQLFSVTPKKKLQRECFVIYGGIDLLLQLFQPPFVSSTDARKFTTIDVTRKSEVWNEILVILREVSFAIPTLSDKIFNKNQIVFLFTLLHHQSVFDNTMNLLEEILATREDTFQLSLIPNFYTLIGRFTARQLSHFCRVLSLLLFEPEDRLVMEGSAVLHSTELLHLRRNRMAKNCNGIVERNQSLIIDTPNLLQRLVQVLRVINFGPNLADLISHNIVSQMPITSDILTFFSSALGITDWDHFSNLERIVEEDIGDTISPSPSMRAMDSSSSPRRRSSPNNNNTNNHNYNNNSNNTGRSHRSNSSSHSFEEDDDITAELLSSFSPNSSNNVSSSNNTNQQRVMDLSNIVNVMQVARDLGIADMTPLGEALLTSHPLSARMNNNYTSSTQPRQPATNNHHSSGSHSNNRLLDIGPKRAKRELQFHAMLLSPHQIELIFVLCTLLSGRRKLNIQQQLAEIGLDKVLNKMFARMSWNISSSSSSSSSNNNNNNNNTSPQYFSNDLASNSSTDQHIHGPGCECDPESALRVQFLRLVHNFYDRDFLGNENKLLMLSSSEIDFVNSITNHNNIKNLQNLKQNILNDNKDEVGLLGKIIRILLNEPNESIYRFWLSACVENFLRGCGYMGQVLVAQTGALANTLKYIIQVLPKIENNGSNNSKYSSSLQTSFDLLGELVKCNQFVLELMDSALSNEEFNRFVYVVMNNLVDSNVFIRSLFFSIDMISTSSQSSTNRSYSKLKDFGYNLNSLNTTNNQITISSSSDAKEYKRCNDGYLSNTWVQFSPIIISEKAIDLFKYSKQAYYRKENKDRTIQVKVDSKKYNKKTNSLSHTGEKFFKDIRKATKHILRFGDNVKDSGVNVKENRSNLFYSQDGHTTVVVSNKDFNSLVDIDSDYMNNDMFLTPKVDEYYTPPEQPKHPRSGSSNTGNNNNLHHLGRLSSEKKQSFSNKINKKNESAALNNSKEYYLDIKDGSNDLTVETKIENHLSNRSIDNINSSATLMIDENISTIPTTSPYSIVIPDSLFRISMFLSQEKLNIILRLMSTVSIRTINHENICCLNTVLLILLLDHKRGCLGNTLFKVKDLADREYRKACRRDLERSTSISTATLAFTDNDTELSNTILKSYLSCKCTQCGGSKQSTNRNHFQTSSSTLDISKPSIDKVPSSIDATTMNDNSSIRIRRTRAQVVEVETNNNKYNNEEEEEDDDIAWGEDQYSCPSCYTKNTQSSRSSLVTSPISIRSPNDDLALNMSTRSTFSTNNVDVNDMKEHDEEDIDLFDNSFHSDNISNNSNKNNKSNTSSTTTNNKATGSYLLCNNFRQLLWYWQEYYLRRGRDRLSIEFSSHIPFKFWHELVDLLCADNGCITSLLSHSIRLPLSPYVRSTCESACNFIPITDDNTIINIF